MIIKMEIKTWKLKQFLIMIYKKNCFQMWNNQNYEWISILKFSICNLFFYIIWILNLFIVCI